ncbi:hypothetical protein [Halioxenophilus sp. WMMB6]|uniref:hypothetical protein n=1 Tax=Halioxenophilus sp. WMMB6 TaxID=3073815 RepID=UPI00295EDE93|nr:hypothetical protein [Halioxenophilus sp. WMMB6]
MNIDSEQLAADMAKQGFCVLQGYFPADELQQLQLEAEAFIEQFYTRENLAAHSVYPSDSTETRVSHAAMIAEGNSEFPTVGHCHFPTIDRFLREHNQILTLLSGQPVAPGSRCMLNYQNYFSGSKPVGEHFDGEYLRAQKAADGVEFQLLEGILPRYVAVMVVANANEGKGIELLDNRKQKLYAPTLNAGDMVVFDNIYLRHRVPLLEQPRISIGLRNFDHLPWHFAADDRYFQGGEYHQIAEGWVSPEVDCTARLRHFMAEEWPAMQDEYSHYF